MTASDYTFQPYDVVQVLAQRQDEPGGVWLDFSTLRTDSDAADARSLVNGTHPGFVGTFRIVRGGRRDVVMAPTK